MRVRPTTLAEVLLVELEEFADKRGSFLELWRDDRYADAGIPGPFVQENLTRSAGRVLRGLHFQEPKGQGKLIQVLDGAIFDVAVDVRRGSPSFGQCIALELRADEPRQLWIPAGFAHGFCVLSAGALVLYRCTERYAPESERAIAWNDPALEIAWPIADPIVSPRDAAAGPLADARILPLWRPAG